MKPKMQHFTWAIVRTTSPKMPQMSFFFDPERAEDDIRIDAESYARQLGFEVVEIIIEETGTFILNDKGLII